MCLLGHYLGEEGVLEPLRGVEIAQKTVKHSPQEKLIDALVGILSGCKALFETNVRVRPDVPLSQGLSAGSVADRSTIQRTLNAFGGENLAQLGEAVGAIGRRYSVVFSVR